MLYENEKKKEENDFLKETIKKSNVSHTILEKLLLGVLCKCLKHNIYVRKRSNKYVNEKILSVRDRTILIILFFFCSLLSPPTRSFIYFCCVS